MLRLKTVRTSSLSVEKKGLIKMALSIKYYSCHIALLFFIFVNADIVCRPSTKTSVTCKSTNNYVSNVLQSGLVSDNNKTTELIFLDCKISEIKYGAFKNLFSVEHLDLTINKISNLPTGVLDGMPKLKTLSVSKNLLTGIPLGIFDHNPNLNILDLNENRIRNLQLGIFDPLINLKWLDLTDNSLKGKYIDFSLFNQSKRIIYINFARNNMDGTSEKLLQPLEDLRTLNLDQCVLSELPKFATGPNLRTLQKLIISSNEITNLGDPTAFIHLENLTTLNLANNFIDYIDSNAFKPLKNLKVLVLRRNKLSNIPDTLFTDMTSVDNIDLSYNDITSIPVNAFRGTSLKTLNVVKNRITYLPENFCSELRNSGATLTKFFLEQNPWQCLCLINIVEELKKYRILYNARLYDGKHPICVTPREIVCQRHDTTNSEYTKLYDKLILGLPKDT